MPETPVGQRLKLLIQTLGLDARTFSQALDVAETTTRNYLNRGTKPGTDYLEKLSNSFDTVNLHWLLTGKGAPLLAESPAIQGQANIAGEKNLVNVAGINHGTATLHNYTVEDCKKERDSLKAQLDLARQETESLRTQLGMKDTLIAAKDETIDLLRVAFNRPN